LGAEGQSSSAGNREERNVALFFHSAALRFVLFEFVVLEEIVDIFAAVEFKSLQ
jgi:hypothetical protein